MRAAFLVLSLLSLAEPALPLRPYVSTDADVGIRRAHDGNETIRELRMGLTWTFG